MADKYIEKAARVVCHAVAHGYHENRNILHDEDDFWTLLNLFGDEDYPEEVMQWASKIGSHVCVPKGILAMYAIGRDVPTREEAFPDEVIVGG